MTDRPRMVVGICGATGTIYGVRLLQALNSLGVETHLVMSKPAELTAALEGPLDARAIKALADHTYPIGDFGAAVSSGSFSTLGMIVAPCSVRSLCEIAAGTGSNLLTRAADVCLKERRRLVLMVRETPLSLVHLRAMAAATEAGAIISPPVAAFYQHPKTIGDIVDHTVGRVLDLFSIENDLAHRWKQHP